MIHNQPTPASEVKTATPAPFILDGLNNRYAQRHFIKSQRQQRIDPVYELFEGIPQQSQNELLLLLTKIRLEKQGYEVNQNMLAALSKVNIIGFVKAVCTAIESLEPPTPFWHSGHNPTILTNKQL